VIFDEIPGEILDAINASKKLSLKWKLNLTVVNIKYEKGFI